jgi:hypothetical protein
MTFDPRLVPMYELGLEFTQNLWSSGPKSEASCQCWSFILAMDVLAREACDA